MLDCPRRRPATLLPRLGWTCAIAVMLCLRAGHSLLAAEISVPNGSFESPTTVFADPQINEWQKAPEPPWYMGGGGFPWDQLMGQFLNSDPTNANHIDNMDGSQAAFLFALPDVAIFQDYDTVGGTNSTPSHAFNASFQSGYSYKLTVGLIGGGGGMSNGVTFQISLYYRDASSNVVTIAATTITNTTALFPTNTHFIDFSAHLDHVKATDPWAGAHIGIKLASTVGFDLMGGYWDLDNVRLTAVLDPLVEQAGIANGHFQFVVQGPLGPVEIRAATDPKLPITAWTSLAFVTNVTGSVSFTDTNAVTGNRFYRAVF